MATTVIIAIEYANSIFETADRLIDGWIAADVTQYFQENPGH